MMRIYLYLDAEAPSPKNESNMLNEASLIPLYNIYVCVVYVYNISSISLVYSIVYCHMYRVNTIHDALFHKYYACNTLIYITMAVIIMTLIKVLTSPA